MRSSRWDDSRRFRSLASVGNSILTPSYGTVQRAVSEPMLETLTPVTMRRCTHLLKTEPPLISYLRLRGARVEAKADRIGHFDHR